MNASVFIATSLDGFIARRDGGLDWLPAGCEPHGYEEFIASADALVIGRKTYEIVLGFGGWAYGAKPVIEIVAQLAQRGIKHLYIDGGVTVQRFLAAGLIQRMIVTRLPVLLGNGIPLFGPLPHDIRFEHVATRSYPSGLVQREYLAAPLEQLPDPYIPQRSR